MKTFISILNAKTNSYSNEKVVIGLIAVTTQQVYFEYSQEKVNLLNKFFENKNPSSFLKKVLEEINKSVKTHNLSQAEMPMSASVFTAEYFQYLKKYNNGLLQFSETLEIPKAFTFEDFESYFKNFVGVALKKKPSSKKQSIHSKVHSYFKKEGLSEKADIDYNLDPISFKGILKATKVPLITANGTVNAIQIIDFTTQPNTIANHLYETKIIQESLEKFLNSKNIALSKIQIAFDEPELESEQHSIFDMAYSEYKKVFDFIPSVEVDDITTEILNSTNTKFSGIASNQ